MNSYDIFQTTVVTIAVLCSALFALNRLLPGLRAQLANWLCQPQRAHVLIVVGAWLAQKQAGGCDSGCSTCDNCAPSANESVVKATAAKKDYIPVQTID